MVRGICCENNNGAVPRTARGRPKRRRRPTIRGTKVGLLFLWLLHQKVLGFPIWFGTDSMELETWISNCGSARFVTEYSPSSNPSVWTNEKVLMAHLGASSPSPIRMKGASSILLSTGDVLSSPMTQAQQMADAMVLKSLQGSLWRLSLSADLGPGLCSSYLVEFEGFGEQPNRGRVRFSCSDGDVVTSGPWVSKPSEIRKGAVQLSARWKARLPTKNEPTIPVVFVGFIQASSTLSAGGGRVQAEMEGTLRAADQPDKVLGRFRADLLGVP